MSFFCELLVCVATLLSAAGGAWSLMSCSTPVRLETARRLLQAAAVAAVAATVALVFLLLSRDYRVAYVHDYADHTMTATYLVTALWGGQEGSLLVWGVLQAVFTSLVAMTRREQLQKLLPVALVFLAAVQVFFLLLTLFHSNPFTPLGTVALEGNGINPLLRNAYMAVHPPTLYLGFVGFSVPLAFVIAALTERTADSAWIGAIRTWILVAFGFLSIGNLLGMVWAYEELGWGGYWGWDPVENASFMPWLTGTALVHSAMMQARGKGMRLWTVVLSLITFCLVVFGTFLTRSGVVQSVHAFAGATTGPFLLGLIAAVTALTLWLMVTRWSLIAPPAETRSVAYSALLFVLVLGAAAGLVLWRKDVLLGQGEGAVQKLVPVAILLLALAGAAAALVRRMARAIKLAEKLWFFESIEVFSLTNWAFVLAALFVWGATMSPLFAEWFIGEKVAVTPEFYNRRMTPVGLAVLALVFVCLLVGRRRQEGHELVRRAILPVSAGIGATLIAGLGGAVREDVEGLFAYAPVVAVGIIGLVGATVLQELAGILFKRKEGGLSRRRIGAQLVHLSIVVLFIGFVGSAYTRESSASLVPGETMDIGSYSLTLLGVREDENVERQALLADLEVKQAGQTLGVLSPARYVYHSHPGQPTSEVVIRTTAAEDLFLILGEGNPEAGRAVIRAVVNPLVLWVWVGGGLLMLGALVALWPIGVFASLLASVRRSRQTAIALSSMAAVVLIGVIFHFATGHLAFGVLASVGALLVGLVALFAEALGAFGKKGDA